MLRYFVVNILGEIDCGAICEYVDIYILYIDYSLYKNWIKNKTPEVFWRVIDFIEDNSVDSVALQFDIDDRINFIYGKPI